MKISQIEFPLGDGDALVVSEAGIRLKSGSLPLDAEMLAKAIRAYTQHSGTRWFPPTATRASTWRMFKESIAKD